MSYKIIVSPLVEQNIMQLQRNGNKKLSVKMLSLLEELAEHPRSGSGKPEQLKGYTSERWSRRIDQKHRLIYEIQEQELVVIAVSAFGHYGEK